MKNKYYLLLIITFLFSCAKEPIPQYTLTTQVTPLGGGSVSPSSGSYADGTEITLQATPSSEYLFKNWSGGASGTQNPISVTMNANKNITAVFEKRTYPLSIEITGEGTVMEEIISQGKSTDYDSGTTVKLTAVPSTKWEFVSWGGAYEGTDNPIEILVNSSKTITVEFKKIYKNYLKTSYELSNYDEWLSSDDLYENGNIYVNTLLPGPLEIQQHCQLDIDGDGLEDLFYFESYNWPMTNPPPSVFMNNGAILEKILWTGPSPIHPHGVKLLVGDFNNDSLPDIFSSVAVDISPDSVFRYSTEFNHLLFNSTNGFNKIKEFNDEPGFFHTSCSGDIDNDGDLDIIMFNVQTHLEGVSNKILWNDGKGNFNYGTSGISKLVSVSRSELFDVNSDNFLDLVVNYYEYVQVDNTHIRHMVIMWGNGMDFNLTNSTGFIFSEYQDLMDIDFADINNDGISEIIISGTDVTDGNGYGFIKYFIDLYQSDDNGYSFVKKTNQYIDDNNFPRFSHLRIGDINKDGKMDIFTSNKKDNIRWEWNGSMFVKK